MHRFKHSLGGWSKPDHRVMQRHMKQLVIFDCDGVLVDSELLASVALVDCLTEHNIAMKAEDADERFKGKRLSDCLLEIEQLYSCKLPAEFTDVYRARMSEYFEAKLKAIDGVEDAIKKIPHPKCVASNGPLEKMKRNLEITGLRNYFEENIFSAYTIQKWKPDPDLFLHACKTMGSEPQHAVVIEDSAIGIRGALAGGFKVLAYNVPSVQNVNVTHFRYMSELPTHIRSVFNRSLRNI